MGHEGTHTGSCGALRDPCPCYPGCPFIHIGAKTRAMSLARLGARQRQWEVCSEPEAEGTYSSAIMSPWGCFMCLAMAASASSTYSSFSESDTFCRAPSRCSGCRPSCSRARSCESHERGTLDGLRGARRDSPAVPILSCSHSANSPNAYSCGPLGCSPAQGGDHQEGMSTDKPQR